MLNPCSTCTTVKSMQLFLTSICYIYIPTHSTYRKAVDRDCSSSIRKRFTTTKDILSTLFSFHIFLLKKIYILDRNISTGELPFSCIIIENNITFAHKTTKRFSRVNLNYYPFILLFGTNIEYFSFSPPIRFRQKRGLRHSERFSR